MTEPVLRVEAEALAEYARTVPGLADEVGKVGTATLSGTNTLPAGCFSRLGTELGLDPAFQHAAQAQVDGLAAASTGLAALARTVGTTLTEYQRQDVDHRHLIERAQQV